MRFHEINVLDGYMLLQANPTRAKFHKSDALQAQSFLGQLSLAKHFPQDGQKEKGGRPRFVFFGHEVHVKWPLNPTFVWPTFHKQINFDDWAIFFGPAATWDLRRTPPPPDRMRRTPPSPAQNFALFSLPAPNFDLSLSGGLLMELRVEAVAHPIWRPSVDSQARQ